MDWSQLDRRAVRVGDSDFYSGIAPDSRRDSDTESKRKGDIGRVGLVYSPALSHRPTTGNLTRRNAISNTKTKSDSAGTEVPTLPGKQVCVIPSFAFTLSYSGSGYVR